MCSSSSSSSSDAPNKSVTLSSSSHKHHRRATGLVCCVLKRPRRLPHYSRALFNSCQRSGDAEFSAPKHTEPATRFIFEALPIIFVLNSLPCCARGEGKKGNEQQQDSAMSFSAKSVKHAQKTGIINATLPPLPLNEPLKRGTSSSDEMYL